MPAATQFTPPPAGTPVRAFRFKLARLTALLVFALALPAIFASSDAAAQSSDATLSSLAVTGYEFDTPFDSSDTSDTFYIAVVPSDTETVTITLTTSDSGASYTAKYNFGDTTLDLASVPLRDLSSTTHTRIVITVTAADGMTTQGYQVGVNRTLPAGTTPAPPAPTNVRILSAGDDLFRLSWDKTAGGTDTNNFETCAVPNDLTGTFDDLCIAGRVIGQFAGSPGASLTVEDSTTIAVKNGITYRVAVRSSHTASGTKSAWVPSVPPTVTPTAPPAIVLTTDATTYTEGPSAKIVVTATATPAPTADLTVNVRVEGGGIARFFSASGDAAHNNTITISGGETTGTVDYTIHNDGHQEDDTDDQVMATVRDPDTAGAYTFDNSGAPTFMVSNDDQQSAAPSLTSVTAVAGGMTVVWDAPSDTGSRDIRNYSICLASGTTPFVSP